MKWHGKIGFVRTVETSPGIWEEVKTEKPYYGMVEKYGRRWQGSKVNEDIELTNEISIISDSFARDCLGYMKYVTWMGSKWKIASATIDYPRITISLGGLYNENETATSE